MIAERWAEMQQTSAHADRRGYPGLEACYCPCNFSGVVFCKRYNDDHS